MKNLFKTGLSMLVIMISVSACDPSKGNAKNTGIDTVPKNIDTSKKAAIDTAKKDTAKK